MLINQFSILILILELLFLPFVCETLLISWVVLVMPSSIEVLGVSREVDEIVVVPVSVSSDSGVIDVANVGISFVVDSDQECRYFCTMFRPIKCFGSTKMILISDTFRG